MIRLKLPAWSWWRLLALVIVALLGATLLLTYRLASLAPRLNPTEQALVAASNHAALLLNNPLNLPLKSLVWLALKIPARSLIELARIPSVALALVGLGLVAYILNRWYGRRSTVFGLAMIVASAWFLHVARFASPDIEYFTAILALLAVHINLHDHEDSAVAWYVWLGVNAALLLIPGFIWLTLVSALWQWRVIRQALDEQRIQQRVLSCMVPILVTAGLVVSFVRNHSLALTWLGLPDHPSVATLRAFPQHILDTLLAIAWRGPHRPELWLGQLALLDYFLLAMLAVGICFYVLHWRATRAQLLAGYLALGVLLISFGVVSMSIIVPILYLIAVAGIAYALHFWLRIFPRNPIARGVGIGLIAALVSLSCYYNMIQYFVAWPHNAEVEQVYQSHV